MIQRNISSRKRLIEVVEEHGIRYNFISKKLGISNSTLSHFKLGNFDLGKEKLEVIEDFLKHYDKL